MKLRKYTLAQLQEAVNTSVSIREALGKLNIKAAGGNYYIFQKAVEYFNINTSHFTGQNLSGRKMPQRRQPLEKYLSNEVPIQSNKLRKYLIEAKTFEHECSSCKLTTWLRKSNSIRTGSY